MKLLFDLRDVDGRLIAAAGRELNPPLLREVTEKGKILQRKVISLNQPFLLKDFKRVMDEEVYADIFHHVSMRRRLLRMVRKSKLQSSVFKEIVKLRKSSYYTYRHFLLVGILSAKISMELTGYRYNPGKALIVGLIHDLGKTRLPKSLLNKTTALTSNEYRLLHSYPATSLILLKYYLGKAGGEACRVAYDHHEKMDGSGYPRGIKSMSQYTKLIAILDIFDALIADRPYRKRSFTVRGAVDKLLQDMRGGKLPKYPILLLVSYLRRDKPPYRRMKVSLVPRAPEPEGNLYGRVVGS